MRLFVDCDDTLILWDDSARQMNQDHSLWMGDKYKINYPLVDAIREFVICNPTATLIVWSGGGRNYADYWAEKCLGVGYNLALSKDVTLPTEDDVCVDDQIIKVKGQLYTPNEFISAALA